MSTYSNQNEYEQIKNGKSFGIRVLKFISLIKFKTTTWNSFGVSNFDFLENAPDDVVTKNKARLEEVNQQVKILEEQLAGLA